MSALSNRLSAGCEATGSRRYISLYKARRDPRARKYYYINICDCPLSKEAPSGPSRDRRNVERRLIVGALVRELACRRAVPS